MKLFYINGAQWQKLLDSKLYTAPFHTYDWYNMLSHFFKADLTLLLAEEESCSWIIPIFQDLPWLKQGEISTSAIGYGGPLPLHKITSFQKEYERIINLLEFILKHFNTNKIHASLFPSANWLDIKLNPRDRIDNTVKITLSGSAEKTFNHIITGNVRTAIRKSQRTGVLVREVSLNENEVIAMSTRLLQKTQRDVGSIYVTDKGLVETLLGTRSNIIKSRLFVAELHGKVEAMSIAISNQHELFHLYHGWNRSSSYSSANQALIWEMINCAELEHLRFFNMGSSHSKSLLEAKLRYGGNIEPVLYLNV